MINPPINRFLLIVLSLTFMMASQAETSEDTQRQEENTSAQRWQDIPRGTPIVMLNMLKFREAAEYPEGEPKISGEEAYAKYRAAASKLVAEVGGGPVWSGVAKAEIIAPQGEEWDEIFLVRYPSIEKFLAMVNSEAYQAVVHHRSAALADSRLIAMVEKGQ